MDRYEYRFPQIPLATRNLMIACAVIFVLQQIPGIGSLGSIGGWINQTFMLYPPSWPQFRPWQPVTYAFLHYDVGHIVFNLLGLFMFGTSLEQLWGRKRYLQLLAASVVMAGVIHIVISTLLRGQAGPLLGISGGVFGLLMAQAMMFPHQPTLFFMVLPMENRTAVAIFGAIELLLGVSHDGVAHFAHLGGMLGAWLIILWWRRGGGSGGRGSSKKPPLRRVH